MGDPRNVASFRAAPAAYDLHIGRYGAELARALCDRAGVREGATALDVGCGPGALTAELAARLGPAAVAAADPSVPFAEGCRARLPGVRVEIAGAERLPFGDAEFDRVLAQLVVNFMDDAHAGVGEMARVARPGGVVGAAVWDYAGEMTLLREFWAVAAGLDAEAAALDEGAGMRFCTPGELEDLWHDAGLRDVEVGPAVVGAAYRGFTDLWAGLETGVGPSGAYVLGLPEERRATFAARLRDRLGVGEEPFRLTARAWIVTGARA